ncbi:MAG: CotH kinase family protein, partial [Phycisphaerales bacterium]
MSKAMRTVVVVLVLTASLAGSVEGICPVGDLTGDCKVDSEDLRVLAEQWLGVAETNADLNGDEQTGMADFALLAQNWRRTGIPLLINEFMASNASALSDEDGDSSDWIEIHNPTDRSIDLDNLYLTDDPCDLTKWRFPSIALGPGRFLTVFASGKNRALAGSELHTNFRLDIEGDYIALVGGDGVTIGHEYAPRYPQQLTDVSYGLSQNAASLVTLGVTASYHVPTAGDAATDWTARSFDDSLWDKAPAAMGFSAAAAWTGQDVGNPTSDGSYTYDSDSSTFSVRGGGSDIWGNSDQFYYVYQLISGEAEIVARINNIDNTHAWAKAGIMIRESLDASSKNVLVDVTSANGVSFQRRTSTGGEGYHTTIGGLSAPYWVKLVRRGDTFTGYRSADGASWTLIDSDVIPMSEDAYAGLAVTAHNDAGPLCTAVFTNVTIGSEVTGDLKDKMFGVNTSLWTRIAFEADETDSMHSLTLRMKYEDGFVAYLNGVEVARDNFSKAPRWDSVADSNRPSELSEEFADFDVSGHIADLRDGYNVLAIQALNNSKDDEEFLIVPQLVAAGRATVAQYFTTVTPGQPNVSGAIDAVADTRFSHNRGFYDAPFEVAITCDTPGATVHFTTDGSAPTEVHGYEYIGPVPVHMTTVLRAMAFKPGWMSTNVDTHTYIFPADVVRQGTMSRTITDDRVWGPQLQGALLEIPAVSLVTPHSISETERQTSLELIFPDGRAGLQVDAGVELFGGTSLGHAKKSMRISFKRIYGPSRLRFDMFGSCPFGGDDATDEFDQILLRSGSHDAMYWVQPGTGAKGIFIRNRWIFDRQLEMGQPAPRGRFVHLYINGVYWGQYHLMERPNGPFMASYFGGGKDDYDTVKGDYGSLHILNGDSTAWYEMLASTSDYRALCGYMDVVNYADYLLVNFYVGNDWDWKSYQNWMAARKRRPDAGYKFFCWDNDVILRTGLNANVVNQGGPGNMWNSIKQHEDFRMLLADRAHRYFFNEGMLTRNRVLAQLDELARRIERTVITECARWGVPQNYTPTTWQEHLDWVKTEMVAQRTEVVV